MKDICSKFINSLTLILLIKYCFNFIIFLYLGRNALNHFKGILLNYSISIVLIKFLFNSFRNKKMDNELRIKLQLYLLQKIRNLKSSESSLNHTMSLVDIMAFLVGATKTNTELEQQFRISTQSSIQAEFKKSYYQICFKEVLINLEFTIMTENVTLQAIKERLIQIMEITNFSDSFNTLYELSTGLRYIH